MQCKDPAFEIHEKEKISLTSKDMPLKIVARIETERAIVHGNRELIRLYKEKVNALRVLKF